MPELQVREDSINTLYQNYRSERTVETLLVRTTDWRGEYKHFIPELQVREEVETLYARTTGQIGQ